jgi:hypothetical protein
VTATAGHQQHASTSPETYKTATHRTKE